MSWSEPGARHPPKGDHTWHRLSVHVKRQEAGSNQTAVIKPLTNSYQHRAAEFSDLSTKTLYNVAEEDEESEPVRYNPPGTPPMMALGQIAACGLMTGEGAELYTPENSNLRPKGLAGERLQGEMVVSRVFSGEVVELGRESSGMPVYHQAHLIQQEPVLPVNLDQFDPDPAFPLVLGGEEEEEEGEEGEQFGLLQGYVFDNSRAHEGMEEVEEDEEDLAEAKLAVDDSLALMPPSPFRDSAGAPASTFPSSPVSESILCSPPHVSYASVILGDFKQSSSTL